MIADIDNFKKVNDTMKQRKRERTGYAVQRVLNRKGREIHEEKVESVSSTLFYKFVDRFFKVF